MTKPKSNFVRAKYQTLTNDKANSSCGTMQFQTGKENSNFFGDIGLWYAATDGNYYLEQAMGSLRHQIKRIIHKHLSGVIYTIIDINYAEVKQYASSTVALSHFNLQWNVQLKDSIYLLDSLDIFKAINDEIIDYLYSIEGCGFTHKGNRKPRKKTSEYLKGKLTTDITHVENVS
jgi:hypothetical protein